MLFLINNPLVLVIGIVLIGFITLMIVKIIKEISLNKLLEQKHGVMRVVVSGDKLSFSKRMAILTSTALAPVAVVAVVLTIGASSNITPSGELRELNNVSELVDVYESFNQLLPSVYQNDFYTAFEDSGTEFTERTSGDLTPTVGTDVLYNFATSADQRITTVYGSAIFEDVAFDSEYYYIKQAGSIEITLNSNGGTDSHGTVLYDSIVFTNEEDGCSTEQYVNGFYVDDNYLTVIVSQYPVDCDYSLEGYVSEYASIVSNMNVSVVVFDKGNNFEVVNQYVLSGKYMGSMREDGDIYVVTKSYLDYQSEGFNIEDYLPSYRIDNSENETKYNDIIYIEGTAPDSFTSFYAIDINNSTVETEVLLVDYTFNLYFKEDSIELSGNIYYFEAMSNMFEFEDNINELKTIIITLDINNAKVEYSKIEIE